MDNFEQTILKRRKYMKKCETTLAIKEMQIKTTLKFHLSPVKLAIVRIN
jgi:hypothetical protein